MANCSSQQPGQQREVVVFVHSDQLLKIAAKNPRNAERGQLVYSLIKAYGLLDKMKVVEPRKASRVDLLTFHSPSYLQFLEKHVNHDIDDLSPFQTQEAEEYGLGYDCPLFEGLYDYVAAISGSTLTAAQCLTTEGGGARVAINWYGGRHHGLKDEASGFCYCNDIVLAILHLLETFTRVLYVDIDIHHGDGVEGAFYHSPRVFTLSFHKHSPGFFPGSGGLDSVGSGPGKYHCLNVPLQDGLRDDQFHKLFTRVVSHVKDCYKPDVIVMQCGADMLSGDPIGTFSLTPHGLGDIVHYVLEMHMPTLLLGGGGYNFANTARFWAICTAMAVNVSLPLEIPEHDKFKHYGPDFELAVTPGNRTNENTDKTIEELLRTVEGHLQNLTDMTESTFS